MLVSPYRVAPERMLRSELMSIPAGVTFALSVARISVMTALTAVAYAGPSVVPTVGIVSVCVEP